MADTYPVVPDKEELLRQEEELEKKNKWMYPVVITLLIIIFTVGFIYGLRLVLNIEGTFPPVVLTESKTPVPETNRELVDYLSGCAQTALQEKPAVSAYWSFSFDKDSIQTDGSDWLKKTLSFLADPASDAISASVGSKTIAYGEPMDSVLRIPVLEPEDIESFTCDYIYYKCRACGNEETEPTDGCAICGSDSPYEMHYRDKFAFTVNLKPDSALSEQLFAPGLEEIKEAALPALDGYATVESISSGLTGLSIYFETNRLTDSLLTLRYRKAADVTATILPADGGEASTSSASASTETVFDFSWPAVILNRHELALEPGKRDQITAERVCDDPKSYEITWTSSDESVAVVDQKGYVKACKLIGSEPGKATITASFTFNGKTYSDSCEVTVKVGVEYLQVSRHKLTLQTGETYTLTTRVASDNKGFAFKKPTVQTVTWYTTDASVAAVDENGNVTAVGPGDATVYALSDDGYYRSSCKVTVK